MGESFVTNVDCGGIKSGSEISSDDTLQDIVKSMVWSDEPPAPPTEYESKNIGTWSSASDVDNFFTTRTAWNRWAGLKLGNYVTIQDGTHNTQWEIAGFNCEYNQTAADGTVYDNGVGLCMIPKTQLPDPNIDRKWNHDNTVTGGYMSSYMHASTLVILANGLKNILGNHLIGRNVLLSSSVDSNGYSNAYTWTTAYCTLMSIGQCNGTFASHRNKYDDGEANYKLPVFDHENYWTGSHFWTRNIWGSRDSDNRAWIINDDGFINYNDVYNMRSVRPLIYLR